MPKRLLYISVLAMGLMMAMAAQLPAPPPQSAKVAVEVPKDERSEFLILQRDLMELNAKFTTLRGQLELEFQAKPEVAQIRETAGKLTQQMASKREVLAKACSDKGKDFDDSSVNCKPKEKASGPPASK